MDNRANCDICKLQNQGSMFFIENEKGEWLENKYDDIHLTKEHLKAMSFIDSMGKHSAEIFLCFMQNQGKLLDFKITEHSFKKS